MGSKSLAGECGVQGSTAVDEVELLYEVSRALAESLDLGYVLERTLGILAERLGLDHGTLCLYDPVAGELHVEAAHGLTREEMRRGRYKVGEGVTGRVLETLRPIVIPDVARDRRFLYRTLPPGHRRPAHCAFICVPIQISGEPLGVLSVDRRPMEHGGSMEKVVRLLLIVGSLVGQAIQIRRLAERERRAMLEANRHLQRELEQRYAPSELIASSPPMMEVLAKIRRVAKTRATVLIEGETGTGKELVARAIHYASPRANRPFIKMNCGAIPEGLMESELFGHERGAFTGARDFRKGRFELADDGTLFLDEIGEMPTTLQVKLLRVLQDKAFERVGGDQTICIDVRIIAATNRDLQAAIREGQFREDLYFRLNVVPIALPPLRERQEEIPLLAKSFLDKVSAEHHRKMTFAHGALEMFLQYDWPGNVRELENTVERLVILAPEPEIGAEEVRRVAAFTRRPSESFGVRPAKASGKESAEASLEEIEKERIVRALQRTGGVQTRASRLLRLTPRQLAYRMRKYNLRPEIGTD